MLEYNKYFNYYNFYLCTINFNCKEPHNSPSFSVVMIVQVTPVPLQFKLKASITVQAPSDPITIKV